LEYLKYNPIDSAVSEDISYSAVQKLEDWQRYRRYKYDLPSLAMKLASKLPFVGSKALAK